MNDRIHAGLAALSASFVGGVLLVRWAVTGGQSRPGTRAVLDEESLDELLDGGEVEANDFAYCVAEQRTTFHALRTDGSRRCWTCNQESAGVA